MSSSSDIHHFHLTVELLVSATGWFEIDELIRKRQRMESFAVDQVMFCSFHAVRCQLSCCGLYVCRLSIVAISKCAVECGVEFVLQFCEIWVLQFCYVHKHKHSPASLGCLCGGNFCVWSWMWSVEVNLFCNFPLYEFSLCALFPSSVCIVPLCALFLCSIADVLPPAIALCAYSVHKSLCSISVFFPFMYVLSMPLLHKFLQHEISVRWMDAILTTLILAISIAIVLQL